MRPIGIPTVEDKVLQKAIAMVLTPIYEQEFFSTSYGFREGRSQHQALEYVWKHLMDCHVEVVLDLDIQKFFDRMSHKHLRDIVRKRVQDGVITRLIGKWLKAGVVDGEALFYPTEGTPQGDSISPLLSNIFLHEVLDRWFEAEVKPRMKGKVFMVRFVDDVIMGFECKEDAERVLRVLSKRLAAYGLNLHPEKTRLIPFKRPEKNNQGKEKAGAEKPGTFNFLGFTHYWGRSKNGNWVVKRKTAQDRFRRSLHRIKEWCQKNRHRSVKEQYGMLVKKLKGHYAYYGITGNGPWLQRFREAVKKIWRKWLARRSRRGDGMTWERFGELIRRVYPLPIAKGIHSIYAAKP